MSGGVKIRLGVLIFLHRRRVHSRAVVFDDSGVAYVSDLHPHVQCTQQWERAQLESGDELVSSTTQIAPVNVSAGYDDEHRAVIE